MNYVMFFIVLITIGVATVFLPLADTTEDTTRRSPRFNTYRKIGDCNSNDHETRCSGRFGQPDGICLWHNGKICIAPKTQKFRFNIEVNYLSKSRKTQGGAPVSRLFIRGSGPGLSWENSIQVLKSARNVHVWTTVIEYMSNSDGLECTKTTHCALNQKLLRFRLYRDQSGKDGMLGPDFVINLPVSSSLMGSAQFLVPNVRVYPWFNIRSSSTKSLKYTSSYDEEEIQVRATLVYPPSFNENTFKRYKLVILLDNDDHYIPLFDHLTTNIALIDEVLVLLLDPSDMVWEGQFEGNRTLLPFDSFSMECGATTKDECIKCHYCRDSKRIEPCSREEFIARSKRCLHLKYTKGINETVRNIVIDQLMEMVRQEVGTRVVFNPPRERVTVIGYGEQAVMAFVLGLSRPDVFGNIGCLSPKFYLPLTAQYTVSNRVLEFIDKMADKFIDYSLPHIDSSPLHLSQKYYFSHGERDDINFPLGKTVRVTHSVIEKLKLKFRLREGVNLMYQTVHDEGLLYPDDTTFPMMSLLQNPLLYFHKSEGAPNDRFAPDISTLRAYFTAQKQVPPSGTAAAPALGGPASTAARNDTVIEINYRESFDGSIELSNGCGTVSYEEVPLFLFLGSIGCSVVVSVIIVVILMCVREENRQAAKDKEREDKELLAALSSSDELY